MSARRVLVIGLDGSNWDLLHLLIKKGELPNLERLREKSVYGVLKSTIPPVTAPAWVSFATGKNPGKHGCFDFLKVDSSLNDIRVISSCDIGGPTFYEILDIKGFRSILINLPLAWPPLVRNAVVTASITSGVKEKVYPENTTDTIPLFKKYRIVPIVSLAKRGKLAEYVYDVRKLERDRFDIAKCLFLKKWDFFFILFSGTDFIQHYLYHKLTGLENSSRAIKLYRDLDLYVGWFSENISSDTILFIISDHGFRTYKGKFHVNEWLRREGFLYIRRGSEKRMFPHEFAREGSRFGLKFKVPVFFLKNIDKFSLFYIPYRIIKKILSLEAESDFKVISEKTSVYCISNDSWGLFINAKNRFRDGFMDDKEYQLLREKLIEKLSLLKDHSGEKVFAKVLKKEDVYWGDNLDKAPDVIFIPDSYSISRDLCPTVISYEVCSDHSLYGVFMAYGRDVREGVKVSDVRIWDLAPTILHLFNLSIPNDMDGRVLTEIFREGSKLAERKVVYEKKEGEKEKIKRKIKEMKSSRSVI